MQVRREYSQENVAAFKQIQHELDRKAADFELRAKAGPFLCADEAWFTTQGLLRHLRQKGAERYGVDVDQYGWLILSSALERAEDGRTPRCGSLGACTVAVSFVHLYIDYATNFAAMKDAYRRPDIWGINVARCVCELYASLMRERLRSAFVALETVQRKFPEAVRREALVEVLVGYFDSQLSAGPGSRLGRALSDERQVLLQELPAEAVAVWADRGQDELKALRNRISLRLQQLGRESSFKDKVTGVAGNMPDPGEDDVAIEDFELQLTMQQEMQQLQEWVERTKFSEQQRQVYELDMSTGYDDEAIACELGITKGHVRKVRYDYLKKIRQAAGL